MNCRLSWVIYCMHSSVYVHYVHMSVPVSQFESPHPPPIPSPGSRKFVCYICAFVFASQFISAIFWIPYMSDVGQDVFSFYSLHSVWQSLGSPTEKAMTSNPILLPGKSHGQRSPVRWSAWGLQVSDTTERLHFHFSLWPIGEGNGNPLMSLPGESQGRGCLAGCCLCVCTESDTTEVM